MTKYLLGLISLWLMCSCSDTDPGETPPIDPPTPTPTVTITKPEFVFGFQGQSKYSYCPSALKQADGTVHLYFCGNPENLIMVDNIFHIKINPDGTQTAAKSVLQPGVPGSWDDHHTCDPSVIEGNFTWKNTTYKYAMFFLSNMYGVYYNEIGVAFSNDLDADSWVKYPQQIVKKTWSSEGDQEIGGGGKSAVTGNIFTGILYAGLVLGGVWLICKKMLKIPVTDFKVGKPDLHPFWIIAAFAMPLLVILVYQLFAGTWQQSSMEPETIKRLVAGSVAYLGLATGIVEETVFRGVIMSSVEYAWNRKIAVIVPSVLFGCLHIEEGMSISGMIQVVIAGSLVGILFSLVTCYTGTIWYSALMHGVWNCLMIGGLIYIGSAVDGTAWYNYVLDTDSFLLTGGEFGVESSVISIAAYLLFAVIALLLLSKKKEA